MHQICFWVIIIFQICYLLNLLFLGLPFQSCSHRNNDVYLVSNECKDDGAVPEYTEDDDGEVAGDEKVVYSWREPEEFYFILNESIHSSLKFDLLLFSVLIFSSDRMFRSSTNVRFRYWARSRVLLCSMASLEDL